MNKWGKVKEIFLEGFILSATFYFFGQNIHSVFLTFIIYVTMFSLLSYLPFYENLSEKVQYFMEFACLSIIFKIIFQEDWEPVIFGIVGYFFISFILPRLAIFMSDEKRDDYI